MSFCCVKMKATAAGAALFALLLWRRQHREEFVVEVRIAKH